MGWLNANHESAKKPRRELYTQGSPYLQLPPLSDYEQNLVKYWFSCGTVQQTSAGLIPLDWPSIISWATYFHKRVDIEVVEHPRIDKRYKPTYSAVAVEGCNLTDWEIEQIRALSEEYVSEYSAAGSDEKRECPTPIFLDDITEDVALANANSIADGLKNLFGHDSTPDVEAVPNK